MTYPAITIAVELARRLEEGIGRDLPRDPRSARAKAMARGAALRDTLRLGLKEGRLPHSVGLDRANRLTSELLQTLAHEPPPQSQDIREAASHVRSAVEAISRTMNPFVGEE